METDIVKVREKLANDILLRLGDEMIDIELTPNQLQKCIDLALAKLRQRSDAFVEEALVLLTLKKNQKEYILPDEIIEILHDYQLDTYQKDLGSVKVHLGNNIYEITTMSK